MRFYTRHNLKINEYEVCSEDGRVWGSFTKANNAALWASFMRGNTTLVPVEDPSLLGEEITKIWEGK